MSKKMKPEDKITLGALIGALGGALSSMQDKDGNLGTTATRIVIGTLGGVGAGFAKAVADEKAEEEVMKMKNKRLDA